ncbi:MAG: IS30 family transposase, partial [Patescibacteria group bacterium]
MNNKGDLTRAERLEIGILLEKKYSKRAIARALGRSPNTISYEVRENSTLGVYDPRKADAKARVRKHYRKLEWSKIEANPALMRLVVRKLKRGWNPDEIAGYLKRTKAKRYVSKTAIYIWLRTSRGERYCELLYSKRKRVKKQRPKAKKVLIPNRVGIAERSAGADNRTRGGHWERDTVVGRKGTSGGLATAQERKTRLVVAQRVESMRPIEHLKADQTMFEGMKTLSVSRDNGIENREHEALGIPSFFCDAYSSWQKGSIENANKMLRRYFPKGTDFSDVSQDEVDRAVRLINEKPRRILGYRSSLAEAARLSIIRKSS